ncbi:MULTISPECIES: LysR substrate-binding domain-containing protein [Acinetobacter]|uniref:LysR substrate-binding domain-containing protein n=1 Tax=Acinetobacter TaxID=469 RepID=UPI0009926727|nr:MULTISPECIES: LysR substrate-binding domain-containing protein [Acinetobacter]MCL6243014.1 LysR substrate-binding domain-containing protein [Acinetobacter amyesii]OOV83782.1 LysR family transcriptional regulator [Acinetobacter sp. ANC 5600]
MQNLNDYYYFVQVVKYQGYTKASEALGITKSKLSRRITELETRLGVRLIQRNTRKFTVTEIGQQFYLHCLKILEEVSETENFVLSTLNDQLCGQIKISCPVALVEMPVAKMVTDFMQQYPEVSVHLMATNHRVDVIEEGVDLAIRVRNMPLLDSDLIVRDLDAWDHVLVASPQLFFEREIPQQLAEIQNFPCIGFDRPKHFWDFRHREKSETQQIEFHPRLRTDSFSAMISAALSGVGIASLPKVFVRDALKSGELIELFPEWQLPQGVIHVAYATRQGMLPGVRAMLDHLISGFKALDIDHP